jgi:hypothetical protein
MRTLKFKPSFREQLNANQRGLDMLADLSGKPRIALHVPVAAKKRARAGSTGEPLERDVQAAIIAYLLHHPQVRLVERINSGTATDQSGNYVRFHTIYQKGLRKPDLDCMLADGRRMVIEVKRPGWTKPINEREEEQGNYLALIRSLGGIGIFATCIEDVQAALK